MIMATRRVLTVLAALTATAALVAGCGGDDAAPVSGVPHLAWGQVHQSNQIDVSAQPPTSFTSSPLANPYDTESWRTIIVVTNRGERPYSPAWLRVYAAADGDEQREVIDPANGCNGVAAQQPIMPGDTVGIPACWAGSDSDQSLTFTSLTANDTATFGG